MKPAAADLQALLAPGDRLRQFGDGDLVEMAADGHGASPPQSLRGEHRSVRAMIRSSRDELEPLRRDLRGPPLGGAAAVQHRRRRLRQASARQAGDDLGELRRLDAGARLGRAAGPREPGGAHARGARRRAGRPRRRRAAADTRDGRDLLRRLEARRDPALDVGAVRRRRDRAPALRLAARGCSSPTPQNAPRFDRPWAPDTLVLEPDTLDAAPADFVCADTSADDPAQLYYTSGTTGLAKGIVHAHRYVLAHEEFVYCHEVQDGERFHGMGEWAWAAGIAPLLGPWRLGAVQCVYRREGGFDPHKQLDFLSRHRVTNVFTTPTAMRSMMAIEDAGTRYPQVFRRVCSAGEPLNPEAIRWFREQYGLTVLDFYGLTESYPLVANFPFMEVREGSMGKPMPGLGRADPRRGRAAGGARRARRDLPARAVESALSARLLAERGGERGDVRRRVVPHEGRRRPGRGRLLLVRRPRRRRDHRGGLPHRAVRGRVGMPRARGGARGRRRRVAGRAARQRRQGVHRPRRRIRAVRRARGARSTASSASGSPRTRIRGASSSSPTCRRR